VTKKTKAPPPAAVSEIIEQPLGDILSERYLAYALSTIMARSLPDVRDGLKPVHRRILHAMRQLALGPTTSPKKSARVVGDVIGKFHPHGDTAVYDAMVRLAQDFAARYPLVDGQGNFGNIDGDSAAAMRYTEARLTAVAEALLEGIDEDAVDFRATYDGEGREPIVLPSNFPNLLANGSQGIAVGMATSIPPHNVAEICDALELLIDEPDCTIEALVEKIPGPDFPTGGILIEPQESIREAYRTGRGSMRLRARWTVEKQAQGQYLIVVTEVPYQVQKSRLVEKIAELLSEKKLPLLEDVRDESAEDVRLVLEPKSRNVEAAVLMEQMFKLSDLEVRISLNMNVLDHGIEPRVMNLKEVLRAFLEHRHDVLVRRSKFRLAEIERRLEILGGYLIAYLNLDEVIRIIREEDEPKAVLIKRFTLTDLQAESILNMRLRQLRKLDEIEIKREHTALTKEKAEIQALLDSEKKRWNVLRWQVGEIRKKFGKDTVLGKRRTLIEAAPDVPEVSMDAFIEREPVTVLLSAKGWVRAAKGHIADTSTVKYKEGDRAQFELHAETTDKLLLFGTNGRFYSLGVDKLPGGRGFGEPVRLMVDLGNDADIVMMKKFEPGARLLVASDDGRGFIVKEDDVVAQTRAGKLVLDVAAGGEAKIATPVPADATHVAVLGESRKLLIFKLDEVPEQPRGRGVILHGSKSIADAKCFNYRKGLTWKRGEQTRTETDLKGWIGERGQAGKLPPQGFPKSNRFG
jgi:topoisomerase IV subunit A